MFQISSLQLLHYIVREPRTDPRAKSEEGALTIATKQAVRNFVLRCKDFRMEQLHQARPYLFLKDVASQCFRVKRWRFQSQRFYMYPIHMYPIQTSPLHACPFHSYPFHTYHWIRLHSIPFGPECSLITLLDFDVARWWPIISFKERMVLSGFCSSCCRNWCVCKLNHLHLWRRV